MDMPPIQTKLTVNQPGDRYELEADRVAEQVMRMPELSSSPPSVLQRQPAENDEDEETLQAKASPGQTPQVTPELQTRISSLRGEGKPLSDSIRTFMEPRFGHDFSKVRIHTDAQAVGTASAVNARAYTLGRDIVFGAGQYTPGTSEGKRLLAHELTHVVQQGGLEKHDLARAPLDQRAPEEKQSGQCQFSTDGAVRYTVTTGENKGNYYQFPSGIIKKNRANRPLFENPRLAMTRYTGVGSDGEQLIHTAIAAPLNALMSALREVGSCIDDESMKQAYVASAYRPSSKREGERYLGALQITIKQNPGIFGGLKFPSRLENMAMSSLGTYGSQKHKEFVAALAKEPGWGQHLAQELADITENYKAPRGGSAHHSGLAVDINFPYPISAAQAEWHGIHRQNNQRALRSAAGVWLGKFASQFDFASYNTGKEIWHQEWLKWKDSSADPEKGRAPTAPEHREQKTVVPEPVSKQYGSVIQRASVSDIETDDARSTYEVPQWHNLPKYVQHDLGLSPRSYNQSWFQTHSPELRLTVLNLYVNLKGLDLWKFVGSESSTGPGTLEFTCSNIKDLKKTLHDRQDFTSPEESEEEWSSREMRTKGQLHFKHFKGTGAIVQAHIDQVGVIPQSKPARVLVPFTGLAHLITYESYKDVYGIRDILLQQGWDPKPLIGEKPARVIRERAHQRRSGMEESIGL